MCCACLAVDTYPRCDAVVTLCAVPPPSTNTTGLVNVVNLPLRCTSSKMHTLSLPRRAAHACVLLAQVIKKLGKGAQGAVWLVHHLHESKVRWTATVRTWPARPVFPAASRCGFVLVIRLVLPQCPVTPWELNAGPCFDAPALRRVRGLYGCRGRRHMQLSETDRLPELRRTALNAPFVFACFCGQNYVLKKVECNDEGEATKAFQEVRILCTCGYIYTTFVALLTLRSAASAC